jgi:hypothetical protein
VLAKRRAPDAVEHPPVGTQSREREVAADVPSIGNA